MQRRALIHAAAFAAFGLTATLVALNEACTPGDGCVAGRASCGSACVDLASDPGNCGACGNTCAGGCARGQCVASALDSGADGSSADGGVDADAEPPGESCVTADTCPALRPVCEDGRCTAVASITAGEGRNACAVTTAGGVWCWGSNQEGIVPDAGTAALRRPVRMTFAAARAVSVVGPFNEKADASWLEGVCALSRTGGVECVGHDRPWTFANQGPGQRIPISAAPLDTLSARAGNACGHDRTSVSCFGRSHWDYVQTLRPDAAFIDYNVANVAASNGPFEQVVTGGFHACARTTGGAAVCFGANNFMEIKAPQSAAVAPFIVIASGVRQLAAGRSHTCALLDGSGSVVCWGSNQQGQSALSGTFIQPPRTMDNFNATQIWAGPFDTCGRTATGIFCWGSGKESSFTSGQTKLPLDGVRELALGRAFRCALLESGSVQCWGDNGEGQTGTGLSDAVVAVPTAVKW